MPPRDADAIPNSEEFGAGTHPTDETSYLRLTWIEADGSGDIVMGWPSVASPWLNLPEPAYAVQATANVFSIAFTDLSGDLSATPPENTYASVAPPDRHFYRVVKP